MKQHTVAKRYNHQWLCINNDLFFGRFFSTINILDSFKRREGLKTLIWWRRTVWALNRSWSKLNTVYWTFTVLYFTVKLGWHAFYNQLLFTTEPPLLSTKWVTVCQTMRITVVHQIPELTESIRTAHGNLFVGFRFIHRNFLAFLFCFFFFLLKANVSETSHLCYV